MVSALALAGGAFAQASSGGSGSRTNPATSGAGSSSSGAPCQTGCGSSAGTEDMRNGNGAPMRNSASPNVRTGTQGSDKPCTPGATVNANEDTTCTDQFGNKQTLPNAKGNSAK
jgi:hypothetical protein